MNNRKLVRAFLVSVAFAVLASTNVQAQSLRGTWQQLPDRKHSRGEGQTIALHDGRVLALGGFDAAFGAGGGATTTCEILDPAHLEQGWNDCAPMPHKMAMFWATVLHSGHVLVIGVWPVTPSVTVDPTETQTHSFLFYPDATTVVGGVALAGAWKDTVNSPDGLRFSPHSVMNPVVYPDGAVLIAGGGAGAETSFFDMELQGTDDSFIFTPGSGDPANGFWDRTRNAATGEVTKMPYTATTSAVILLDGGDVLHAGGLSGPLRVITSSDGVTSTHFVSGAKSSIFHRSTGLWEQIPDLPSCGDLDDSTTSDPQWWVGGPDSRNQINPGSAWHPSAARLPGGDAVVAGGETYGYDPVLGSGYDYARQCARAYHAATRSWSQIAPTHVWHGGGVRALNLLDGTVFLDGGYESALSETYDAAHDRWYLAGGYNTQPSCFSGGSFTFTKFFRGNSDCFQLREFGGNLRLLPNGSVVRTCGYDYSQPWPNVSCNKAFLFTPRR